MPESVTLYGKIITIKRLDLRSERAVGKTDGDTIWICTYCPKKLLKITLIHELGHCLFSRLGLHNCSIPHDLEEIIVDGFAVMIDELFFLRWR